MTESAVTSGFDGVGRVWGSDKAKARIRRRYAADRMLQWLGLGSIFLAVGLLGVLLTSLVVTGYPAFMTTKVNLAVFLDPEKIDAKDPGKANYRGLVRKAFWDYFPEVTSKKDRRVLLKILSSGAPYFVRDYVVANPAAIGTRVTIPVALSDSYDQLYKGIVPRRIDALSGEQVAIGESLKQRGLLSVADGRTVLSLDLYINPANVASQDGDKTNLTPLLKESIKAIAPRAREVVTRNILDDSALSLVEKAVSGDPNLVGKTIAMKLPVSHLFDMLFQTGEATILNPRFPSQSVLTWFDKLNEKDLLSSHFSWELFSNADSRFPEQAGLLGAFVGSLLSIFVCFLISFMVGIAAAVYLEEFAPKNRLTDLIEVNINNLAAVPSVVFGLLGLAVFLGTFGMPRSSPLVGGMVLSLMTLPTIIITTRVAMKAVPPSIREAAMGVGASRHQVITHHVLALAMPGILTGTIIGLAQALGETAPLLLIGMNAFIPSVDNLGILEPATALPSLIYSWADSPERGFVSRTSAAILVLLGFLFLVNATAIYMRNKLEQRW